MDGGGWNAKDEERARADRAEARVKELESEIAKLRASSISGTAFEKGMYANVKLRQTLNYMRNMIDDTFQKLDAEQNKES